MSAQIIDFAQARDRIGVPTRAHRLETQVSATQDLLPSGKERFQFWTGASGRRYVHTVYDLITCPTLPASNYMLIKRDDNGEPDILAVGRADNGASSLNLAEVRRRGAELGANEVHVHLLANNVTEAKQIKSDLETGFLNTAWPEPKTARAH